MEVEVVADQARVGTIAENVLAANLRSAVRELFIDDCLQRRHAFRGDMAILQVVGRRVPN
jgi:hypothetical protein